MKKYILLIAFSFSLLFGQTFGGPRVQLPVPQFDVPTGLLNNNNLRINHSMSFSSGYSSDKTGAYSSCYTSHLNYQFNPKLDLFVDLNFVNFGSFNNKSKSVEFEDDNSSKILPDFSLEYRPTDNSKIIIMYQSYGGYFGRDWRNF